MNFCNYHNVFFLVLSVWDSCWLRMNNIQVGYSAFLPTPGIGNLKPLVLLDLKSRALSPNEYKAHTLWSWLHPMKLQSGGKWILNLQGESQRQPNHTPILLLTCASLSSLGGRWGELKDSVQVPNMLLGNQQCYWLLGRWWAAILVFATCGCP